MSGAAVLRVAKLTGAGRILAAARHNRRAIVAELGASGHIDPTRCALNVTMEGPDTPQGVADLARSLMDAAGVGKLRKDAVRAVEVVFSLPRGLVGFNFPAYFARCADWARQTYGPVLSADAHHDEDHPHMHVLCLPLVNGRMVGSDLVGGPPKLRAMQTAFHLEVAEAFGLKRGAARQTPRARRDIASAVLAELRASSDPAMRSAVWAVIRAAIERDPRHFAETLGFDMGASIETKSKFRSFTEIMISRGKGAKTHAEEYQRQSKR